jgi:drug/metabolite transporter (DMT)-like permease
MRSRFAPAHAWLLLAMVLWGSAFPSSEWAVRQVPHSVAALFRFGGGAVALIVIMALRPSAQRLSRGMVLRAALAGLVGVFGYNAMFFWGVSLAPSADGSVIFPALTPVLTSLFLIATRAEKARALRVLGLGLGVAGAAFFFFATSLHADGRHLLGDSIFAFGAAIWSAYTLLNRRLLVGMDPGQAVMFATIAGSVALGGLAAPDLPHVAWSGLSTGFWVNAVYLAVGPTAVAYLLYARGIRDLGAATASAMMFTVPLFGTAFSFVFLSERFTAAQAAAALVMLGGAFLAVTAGGPAKAVPPPRPEVGADSLAEAAARSASPRSS